MQIPRALLLLAVVTAGCGYAMPTDDSRFHLACYSKDSCPSGWTCGSVWVDPGFCGDPNRQGQRQGNIVVSTGNIVWGQGPSEPCIPFQCVSEVGTPVQAVGEYCYQNVAVCGSTTCAAGQKCGYQQSVSSFVLKCLDPTMYVLPNDSSCVSCTGSYSHCYSVLEASSNSVGYLVCSSQS